MKALIMLFKLSPIFVLCGLVMSGFDMLMAAPMAFLYAVIVCKITTKRKVMDVMDLSLIHISFIMAFSNSSAVKSIVNFASLFSFEINVAFMNIYPPRL